MYYRIFKRSRCVYVSVCAILQFVKVCDITRCTNTTSASHSFTHSLVHSLKYDPSKALHWLYLLVWWSGIVTLATQRYMHDQL